MRARVLGLALLAALPADAKPLVSSPPEIIVAPRGAGAQITRASLVRDARRMRALAAARVHWAKPGDGACYTRPMFTVYGWRNARVCGFGATRITFE
jgi:hypothetical protein